MKSVFRAVMVGVCCLVAPTPSSGAVVSADDNFLSGASGARYSGTGRIVTITVDDRVTGPDANTFIFADAVAICLVPEPSSTLQVSLAGLGLVCRNWRA